MSEPSFAAVRAPATRFAPLLAFALCACGGGSDAAGEAEAAAPVPAALEEAALVHPVRWDWLGATTDDPNASTAAQVDALASLPRRIALRVVLDPGTPPADYVDSVRKLAAVADVMALPLDSSEMAQVDAAQAGRRARRYMEALKDAAPIWEVGNEVNGNWLGAGTVGKIEAMYDAARAQGRLTAVTFYYENPAPPGHAMLPWIDAHIPPGHRLREGLDYALVSYYEDQNGGHKLTQAEIDRIFTGLAKRFPNARVGFGEYGWGGRIPADPAVRAQLISRFQGYKSSEPAFVGGGFYWHFRQTMSPKNKPDFELLRAAAGRRSQEPAPRTQRAPARALSSSPP